MDCRGTETVGDRYSSLAGGCCRCGPEGLVIGRRGGMCGAVDGEAKGRGRGLGVGRQLGSGNNCYILHTFRVTRCFCFLGTNGGKVRATYLIQMEIP